MDEERERTPSTDVAFLTNGRNTPSSRFRVEQFLQKITNEFAYRVRPADFVSGTRLSKISNAMRAASRAREIVFDSLVRRRFFVQRMLQYRNNVQLEKLLFAAARNGVIVDFDDAIYLKNPSFAYTVEHSDLVIAGNRFLADWASTLNSNVKIIPTCVDHQRYFVDRPASGREERPIRVGWTGTKDNLVYLEPLVTTLREMQKKHGFRLVLIADCEEPPKFLSSMPVDLFRWNKALEIDQLAGIDIGLMPLPDTDWGRGKCGFKLIQYMATGALAIGSAVGANGEIIKHGENGLLCRDAQEWAAHLDWALQEFRSDAVGRLIAKARQTIENRYSVAANRDSFVAAITELR
jgi:glycosyltransferase involved in cell wall biosynthesis